MNIQITSNARHLVRLALFCMALVLFSIGLFGFMQSAYADDAAGAAPEGATLLKDKVLDGCVVELIPPGFRCGANVVQDGWYEGADLQLYHLGTSSKLELRWDDEYKGYVIENYKTYHEGAQLGFVWDIEGQSKSDGAQLHVWGEHSRHTVLLDKRNGSQVWKFWQNEDGTYYIQNKYSGLYVSLKSPTNDADENHLKQKATPMKWNLEILETPDLKTSSGSYVTNWDTYRYSSYSDGIDWMSNLPGTLSLGELSIPGTHDSGTANADGSDDSQSSFSQTQKNYIEEQLVLGVRSFDIRLGPDDGADRDPIIKHGGIYCKEKDGSWLRLSEVIESFEDFLEANPGEAIIALMSAADDVTSTKNLTLSIEKHLKSKPDLFWGEDPNKDKTNYDRLGDRIPTLGDARGKVVLLHRFDLEGESLDPSRFGIALTDWGDYDYSEDHQAVKIYEKNGAEVWVQDYYNTNADTKYDYVAGTLIHARSLWLKGKTNLYVYNYTSCTSGNPFSAARNMNDRLANNSFFTSGTVEYIGIVTMDYIDGFWAREIYLKNFGEEIIPFPESASLTYGQTLGEAQFDGVPANVDGYYRFKAHDIMPTVADSEKTLYEVEFVERSSGWVKARSEMHVSVAPRPITIAPQHPTTFYDCPKDHALYADPTDIPYDVIEGSVVDGDRERLRYRIYAVDAVGAPIDHTADAGRYRIKVHEEDSPVRDNYRVLIYRNPSTDYFTIVPKPIDLTWEVKRPLEVGSDVEGSATPKITTDIRSGDDIDVLVKYYAQRDAESTKVTGTFTEEGLYYAHAAEIIGGRSGNYQLLPYNPNLWRGFWVSQKGGPVVFPEKAYLTYGQSIDEAVLDGGWGDGTFTLKAATDAKETPDAGDYTSEEYLVEFSPTGGGSASTQPIVLSVAKRPITVSAKFKQAEYGSALPSFDFTYSEDDLVLDDGIDKLGLVLGAFDDGGENLSKNDVQGGLFNRSSVGGYTIGKDEVKTVENNYAVTVLGNTYAVSPKAIAFQWEGFEDRTYDGDPSNVRASITNLIPAGPGAYDDCVAVVDGGSAVDTGTHRAVITGLAGADSGNYLIPSGIALYQDYRISRADPAGSEVTFPRKATLSYGQALSSATTDGTESSTIEGAFSFVRRDFAPNAGTYRFQMVFVPEDLRNYKAVSGMVDVEVAQVAPILPGPFTVEIPAFETLPLSFIALPQGWTWDDPSQLIENGEHAYAASYHVEDGNYYDVDGAQLTVTGTGPITVFPEYATLTYGQTLADAIFVEGYSDITGYFRFEDPTIRPLVADSDSALYTVEFVAMLDDGSTKIVTGPQIPIKVAALPITIQPFSSTMEYGTEETDVTYNDPGNAPFAVVSGDFIGHDRTNFGLTIYALDTDGTPLVGPRIDAGSYLFGYKLSSDGSNVNYDVTIAGLDAARYTVTQRIVELQWTGQGNVKVGDIVEGSVTAAVANLVQGDDCTVDVDYYLGDRSAEVTDANYETYGFYQAYAANLQGASVSNYAFTSDSEGEDERWRRYFARADNDDVHYPDTVFMVYGQNISEATLIGESGNGTFELRARQGVSETPEAGMHSAGYYMVFTPSDSGTTHPELDTIEFEVKKRPIIAKAAHAFSRYGSALSSFTFAINDNALVLEDTVDDLGLKLAAFDGLGNSLSINDTSDASGTMYNRSPVGIYTIAKDLNLTHEKNYRVMVVEGYFAIARRPIAFSWTGHEGLTYTGEPAHVTAQIENLVPLGAAGTLSLEAGTSFDDCTAIVEQGDGIDAGMHRAVISGLTGDDLNNYLLPPGVSLFQNYLIAKADAPAAPGPFEVKIPVGQTMQLSAIELPAGWTWLEGDAPISIGTRTYEASFHDAQGNYLDVASAPIQVTATQDAPPDPPDPPAPDDPTNPEDGKKKDGGIARTGDSKLLPALASFALLSTAIVLAITARKTRKRS